MITKTFIDRENELEALEERYKKKSFEFVPIYGRRRVGKTELILQFIKNKKSVYFLATSGSKKENIMRFKQAARKVVDLSPIREEWEDIFKYIKEKVKGRIIIAIDEFPYLLESEQGVSSIFQRIIDTILKDSNIFLILCGSSLGMMYKEVLTYKAPLYGRRTGQIHLKPLNFRDAAKFFHRKSLEEIIKIYSVCGGMPAYLKEFTENRDIFLLIREKILEKDAILREEPMFLLRMEFRDPKIYSSILTAISLGNRTLGKIINYCGFPNKTGIMPYLYNLEYLEYVEREIPVTEKPRSKKGLYFIKDYFFDFWFKFVRPNTSLLEQSADEVIKKIKEKFNLHVSYAFENICRELLFYIKPIKFTRVGKWWHKDREIDIVALNEKTKEILFGECKWQSKVNALKIAKELAEKAKEVQWYNKERKESFAIFAKSFSKRIEEFEGKKVYCFDLRDLEKVFRKKLC